MHENGGKIMSQELLTSDWLLLIAAAIESCIGIANQQRTDGLTIGLSKKKQKEYKKTYKDMVNLKNRLCIPNESVLKKEYIINKIKLSDFTKQEVKIMLEAVFNAQQWFLKNEINIVEENVRLQYMNESNIVIKTLVEYLEGVK